MTEKERKKASRRGWLLLADIAVTFVSGGLVGYTWGVVPALAAVAVCTTVFHLAAKRLGLA